MIDLHEGVLELFAEAAERGRRIAWRRREEEGLHGGGPILRLLYHYEYRRRIGSDLRAARAGAVPYVIVPAAVRRQACSTCGLGMELREGCTWWMHLGRNGGSGACPRISRAG